ncbi:class I SAM-dependent methyltransferase [Candidatus Mycobacterium methanotrophicum]|uniref:Class I SAM-dependent methyltransferase n=1 Tax=Candidatus Mycobacterium methanotrophicum TaxID=2943498 RepID=A0ABY4QHN6_9MYCO|nr:class I SAM-dependent methyltransferase [Candidatus Mycobacterium methanotrophicum]UQX09354.1 class I SAM-dependent methyltransferase [Candidatus Mycobacterium methanotrophicum]
MGIAIAEFSPVEQTAFVTAYARALDSRWPRPILDDTLSDDIVAKIDDDFQALGVPSSAVRQTALRAKLLDDRVRAFISEHPDAVVVALGAGLDRGMQRVKPPATVDWYSVDLPNVIALRDQLPPADDHAHSVAASLADDGWADSIPPDRPTMLIADGLLAFLPESVIVSLFRGIPEYFRSGELALNDYGRVGQVSLLAMKVAFSAVGNQWAYRGFKDARVPESWNPRLRLVEEAGLAHAPEVDLYPAAARVSTRLMGMSRAGARTAQVLRYGF